MAKRTLIAGNWKMNPPSAREAEKILKGVMARTAGLRKVEIVMFPPSVFIERLVRIAGRSKIRLGAQDVSVQSGSGAFTGEVSADMFYDSRARYAIVGHSERRNPSVGRGESNHEINLKVKAALSAGLSPVLCVGERERDLDHAYLLFVKTQVEECLKGVSKNSLKKVTIAYEPLWAIGKNAVREATPEEFQEMKIFIKKILADKFGVPSAGTTRILYGGSVEPKNTEGFLREGEADGFLVGRASLSPDKFARIAKIAEDAGQWRLS